MAKVSRSEVENAVRSTGLSLSDEEIERLANDQEVPIESSHAAGTPRATGCEGIRIFKINERCGLYLKLNPPSVFVCCEAG